MPAGTSAPASSDVLGLLNTKPQNTPPTMGGGNWLTVGSWNKPPTGQSLTDYNAWLNKIGVPENTFGQFLINPVTGQYSLPTNQNLQGGIGSKPAYQTFPLYNQPTTPTTTTPTTTTPPPSIYTPDMPNYVGGNEIPRADLYTMYQGGTLDPQSLRENILSGTDKRFGNVSQDQFSQYAKQYSTAHPYWSDLYKITPDFYNLKATIPTLPPASPPNTINGVPIGSTPTTPTVTTPKTPTFPNTPTAQGWLNTINKFGYNPSRMMSYYNRRNQRIQ